MVDEFTYGCSNYKNKGQNYQQSGKRIEQHVFSIFLKSKIIMFNWHWIYIIGFL